jgi:hypothetical protein
LRSPRKHGLTPFFTRNALLVVREPLRAIIDRLDPDVLQFFPISIRTKRGLETEGPWFAMNVTARQVSVVLKRSLCIPSKDRPDKLNFFL